MSDYEDAFEEETPTTSTDPSHISPGDDDSGSEGDSAERSESGHVRSGSKDLSPASPAAAVASPLSKIVAALPVRVPLPVPIPVTPSLPNVVAVPLTTAAASLSGANVEESGAGEVDRRERGGSPPSAEQADGSANTASRATAQEVSNAGREAAPPAAALDTRSTDPSPHSAAEVSKPFAPSSFAASSDNCRAPAASHSLTSEKNESVSVLTGIAGQRQREANEASRRDEFQRLTRYVAFGSTASSAAPADGASVSAATNDGGGDALLTVHDLLGGVGLAVGGESRLQALSHSAEGPPALPDVDPFGSTSRPRSPPDDKDRASTADEEPSSSAFSTLSQHLKLTKAAVTPAFRESNNEEGSKAPSALKSTEAVGAGASAPLPTTAVEPPTGAQTAPAPASASVLPPPVRAVLPALPPPSLAAALGTSSTDAITFAFPHRSAPAATPSHDIPPPLPPPMGSTGSGGSRLTATEAPPVSPPLDPKLLELKETSEVVERLVRAFATLRGHGVSEQGVVGGGAAAGRHAAAFSPSVTAEERLSGTAMHRVGASSTVRVVTTDSAVRSRALAPPAAPLTADMKASLAANEGLMEEVLLSCVLEMLQDDLRQTKRLQRVADRAKRKSQHVTVSAEEFRGGRAAAAGLLSSSASPSAFSASGGGPRPLRAKRRSAARGAFSVFDGEGGAEDAESAAAALFHSVQGNLEKYVLSHVVDPTEPPPPSQRSPPAPSPGGGAVPTPVTPHFAWILLLDLLAVCVDILEHGFGGAMDDGAASIPSAPVIVRYEGERHCELLARNAIHCLPFEVIDAAPPPGEEDDTTRARGGEQPYQPRRRPLFRMEFWVTRAAMFTVVDAIAATTRRHVVHMANAAPYSLFAADVNPYVNAKVLAPSQVPMFSVVLDRQRGGRGASSTGVPLAGMHKGKPRASSNAGRLGDDSGEEGEDAFFGVSRDNMQALAYTVSTLATELLEKKPLEKPTSASRPREVPNISIAESYGELAQAVTETVKELLDDAGIRTAVERRSLEKFEAAQKAKRDYPSKARLERERIVVERAEKDADDLVRKIAQEMLVREAGV